MSTTIADTRRAVGWTVREHAANMGVAPSTVTRMEQSERDDRIQLGTFKRALGVMGRRPRVEVVNNRREERVTMALHRALANKLKDDPQAALTVVPDNHARLRARLTSPIGPRVKRTELEDAIRHATRVTGQREVLVIGSQAILGSYDETQLPERATFSEEVDIAPITDDDEYTLATLIDGGTRRSQRHARPLPGSTRPLRREACSR